jgi:hypothetical protein
MRRYIVNLILALDRLLSGKLIKIPTIEPNERTLAVFDLFKKIYTEAEAKGIKIWAVGSLVVTARAGRFFREINDIDIATRTVEDTEKLENLITRMGLEKSEKKSPLRAIKYVQPETGILVDLGPLESPRPHVYTGVSLDETEIVQLKGFKFRAIPSKGHFKMYCRVFLKKGRKIGEDLVKLKILKKEERI